MGLDVSPCYKCLHLPKYELMTPTLENILFKYNSTYHPIVPFNSGVDKVVSIDLGIHNQQLTETRFADTAAFTDYIENYLRAHGAKYAIGGYAERRKIYAKSVLFDGSTTLNRSPRRVHLGIDIWGPLGTPVYAFMGGMVHSFAINAADGDYGATVILLHQLDGRAFYTLYGHLSLKDIQILTAGQYIVLGEKIGDFGPPAENGNWPPHLHFQVIEDIELKEGDYPGVCAEEEANRYLANCPDPDTILQMGKFISQGGM